MGVKRCAYGTCNSDSRFYHKPHMADVFFITFPKPTSKPEMCDRWIRACSRGDDFGRHKITQDTYVCSKHFVDGHGPTGEHPDPIPATARGVELRIFNTKKSRPPPKGRVSLSPEKKKSRSQLQVLNVDIDKENEITEGSEKQDTNVDNEDARKQVSYSDAATQTDILHDDLAGYSDDHLKQPKLLQRKLFMDDVLRSDKSCKFYTGITSIQLLLFLHRFLQSKAERLTLWKGEETTENAKNKDDHHPRGLSTFTAFLLTLVRLRRGLDVDHLSDLFGISSSTVSRYFRTYIEFISRELSFVVKWPIRLQVQAHLPKAFRYFKKTIAIIDCTEFFVQKPSLPSSQRVTWSQYKHHNTFKCLVAISPTGAFTYISPLWSSSVSDRRIVKESGFLDNLNYGDDIMADRGFLIRDLLALRGCTLNIPPFAHGKQLSKAAVKKTRRIAHARIHVERAIGRLKNFKFLQGIFPLKSKKLINQSVQVCAQLCNFDKPLVK
ncbi:uncharacterized protein LOC124260515 isoform X1 [Haliotis rubra]|uniref:uncharacterized protein LOC124260515 isoform X1 n=1 Tax=Haliotis rubra TaxID=36100 RepID=UPI001EE596EE|nr:uncharacterized protein LOC124260515 isoform X1 [Haliotis rubra]